MAIEQIQLKKIVHSRQNVHKVPMRQWRKWSNSAREMFNAVYSSMRANQWAYQHPKEEKMSSEHWKTVCWNAAWTASETIPRPPDGMGNPV